MLAIQKHFGKKRELLLSRLKKLDITADAKPAGAFYVWANLAKLPPPLDDGMNFFREGLKGKVIVVPGAFFDVNPGNRRTHARYKNYCRISFGPEIEKLELGLDAFERVIKKFKIIVGTNSAKNCATMEDCKKLTSLFARFAFVIAIFIAIALFGGGCASTNMTNPPRSATEQLLLSTSADRAIASTDLSIFAGRKVYLDTTYFDSYDSKYAIGAIRDALSRAGALLENTPTNSDLIVEARAGAYSIDTADTLFGVPNISLPIPFSGPLQVPEIAFYKSQKQRSYAKIALLAYANQSRAHIYSSGSLPGNAYNNYHKILLFSWTTTDLPEKQKTRDKAEKYQTWFPQYDLTNMPATNAPANLHSTKAPPVADLSTNAVGS